MPEGFTLEEITRQFAQDTKVDSANSFRKAVKEFPRKIHRVFKDNPLDEEYYHTKCPLLVAAGVISEEESASMQACEKSVQFFKTYGIIYNISDECFTHGWYTDGYVHTAPYVNEAMELLSIPHMTEEETKGLYNPGRYALSTTVLGTLAGIITDATDYLTDMSAGAVVIGGVILGGIVGSISRWSHKSSVQYRRLGDFEKCKDAYDLQMQDRVFELDDALISLRDRTDTILRKATNNEPFFPRQELSLEEKKALMGLLSYDMPSYRAQLRTVTEQIDQLVAPIKVERIHPVDVEAH